MGLNISCFTEEMEIALTFDELKGAWKRLTHEWQAQRHTTCIDREREEPNANRGCRDEGAKRMCHLLFFPSREITLLF